MNKLGDCLETIAATFKYLFVLGIYNQSYLLYFVHYNQMPRKFHKQVEVFRQPKNIY